MALHSDLLEQALHLARREHRRPRQASLRRAVSAAYYALFHLLADDGAALLAPAQPAGLRPQLRRAFKHADMKEVCSQFAQGSHDALPPAIRSMMAAPLEAGLSQVAKAFTILQEARHAADYDASRVFTRLEVLALVSRAEAAFVAWRVVRGTPNAVAFLAALLLQRQWKG